METLGIIGCGNMGSAIALSLEQKTFVYDTDSQKVTDLAAAGSHICQAETLAQLVEETETLMLCIKPQILPSLYPQLRKLKSNQKKWISVAAGVPLLTLTKELETDEVVRYMPNIAASYKQSVTAIASACNCSQEHLDTALAIASRFGSSFVLPESQFSAFIGISGSAIAYILQFFHALAMGGVREGIAYQNALDIAIQTALSAATLAQHDHSGVVTLATRVCSAGGTTIEGMQALAKGGFDTAVMEAVHASAEKSRKLEELAK
ncbi:MAG: pyrroline-5-carboxylate reductase [Spirochaetia bacterium]|nr:pyrroline-5-carboxylate reductase [Spirochaetia bacterium]